MIRTFQQIRHNAQAVIAHAANRPGHMRAVKVVVPHRVRIVMDEVKTMEVVGETIAVIIDAVAWDPRVFVQMLAARSG